MSRTMDAVGKRVRIGEMLKNAGWVRHLIKLGAIDDVRLLRALSRQAAP